MISQREARIVERIDILASYMAKEITLEVAVDKLVKTGLPSVWSRNLLTTGKL